MAHPISSHETVDALREYLAEGVTGCVYAQGPRWTRRIYVMQGEILAAHGPGDGIAVVQRLVNRGLLTEHQGDVLAAAIEERGQYEELLVGQIAQDILIKVLHDRFRQVLLDFVSQPLPLRFEPMDAVFVENIQVGHDSHQLLEELVALRGWIAPLLRRGADLTLRPGPSMPAGPLERSILDLCRPACILADLVRWSPYEPGVTHEAVRGMLEGGALISDQGFGGDQGMDSAPPPADRPMVSLIGSGSAEFAVGFDAEVDDYELDTADFDGFTVGFDGALGSTFNEASRAPRPPVSLDSQGPQSSEAGSTKSGSSKAVNVALRHAAAQQERRRSAKDLVIRDEQGVQTLPPPPPAPAPASPAPVAELEVFQDFDRHGRGGRDGTFTVERSLLDRVDLRAETIAKDAQALREEAIAEREDLLRRRREAEPDSDIIEMEDADKLSDSEKVVALAFSAPRLPLDEARRRLEVANDVMAQVSLALDRHAGAGAGQASVQLLFDGAPSSFGALFREIEVSSEGRFEIPPLLRNLARRPSSEHRGLINRALMDLIERALSLCVEELDDDEIDALLMSIAGYQQRLRD